MHRKSSTHDLRDLLDAVGPKVESAIQTVSEKAPPAIEKGRATAAVHGTHLAGTLADRLPESVVDRLPDSVADQLPTNRRGRGRKLLLLGLFAGLVGAAVVARRAMASEPEVHRTPPPTPPPAPVDVLTDPVDPTVEPPLDTRQN